jgi:iron(III) transport system permease protein
MALEERLRSPKSIFPRLRATAASPRLSRGSVAWPLAAGAICVIAVMPLVSLGWIALTYPSASTWSHLLSTVLPDALRTTLLLLAGVLAIVTIVGTATAWLVTIYDFPGRRLFSWLLAVPLAMPTYLSAFAYIEIWDYAGPIQSALRSLFGWQSARDYWFPDIRTLGGAIFLIGFALYPYVYLTARASFVRTPSGLLDASRALGHSPRATFWHVALPIARPALAAGAALALMECLNDIGAVSALGVRTLTVTIYNTWLERSNLGGAAQIACLMLAMVLILLGIERWSRRQQRYYQSARSARSIARTRLAPRHAALAIVICALPIAIGFGTPAFVFTKAALTHWDAAASGSFWIHLRNSIGLSTAGAALAVLAGLMLVYARHSTRSLMLAAMTRLASIGYAVPGTVLGLGILVPLAALDNLIDGWMRSVAGIATGLVLTGSAAAIVLAYGIRFLALSQGTIEAGFSRQSPNLDDAARNLGRRPHQVLWEIHLPLVKPAIGAAAVLVFVDGMKELPATLLLRPFNFDTLATHVYTLTTFDMFEEAALPALAIVVVGCIPVIMLQRLIKKK